MRRQGLRLIAVALSLLVLTAGPAQASPIQFADVVAQAVANSASGRQTFDLRLRAVPQSGQTPAGQQAQTQTPSGTTTGQTQTPQTGGTATVTNTEVQTPQGGNVEVV